MMADTVCGLHSQYLECQLVLRGEAKKKKIEIISDTQMSGISEQVLAFYADERD